MDRKSGRQQTTKGIWVAKDPASNLIVLDIEGSDSRERWEGKTQYERSSALFGLVLSNLLIVNIWMHDVGRMAGANLEIIKIIFEINLRFFNQEATKQILFIIRDFNSEQDNLQRVEKIMTEDVQKIWNEIKKPKQFDGVPATQFFELKFYTTSNYEYRPDAFSADVANLAKRLRDPNNPEFYFKSVDTSKNVPFDGLYKFCENVWDAIKENKELNLPSQKIIVSNFRCSEIKKTTLETSKKEVDELKAVVEKENVENLRTKLDDIINRSVKSFQENTDQYDDGIVQESITQLRRETLSQFEDLSNIQKDKIESECIKRIRTQLVEFKQISDFNELVSRIRELKTSVIAEYKTKVERNTTDSEEVVTKLALRFQEKIEGMTTEAVSTKVNVMLKNLHNQKFKQFDQKFNILCSELKPTLSDDFVSLFESTFETFRKEISDIKKNTQEIKNAVDEQLFKSTEMELYLSMRFSVLNRFKSFGSLLLERFRKHFETGEDGMRRNWKVIEESEIATHFKDARQQVLRIIDTSAGFTFPALHSETEKQVFSPEELTQIKTRLDEDMNNIVERVYSLKYVGYCPQTEQRRTIYRSHLVVGRDGILCL